MQISSPLPCCFGNCLSFHSQLHLIHQIFQTYSVWSVLSSGKFTYCLHESVRLFCSINSKLLLLQRQLGFGPRRIVSTRAFNREKFYCDWLWHHLRRSLQVRLVLSCYWYNRDFVLWFINLNFLCLRLLLSLETIYARLKLSSSSHQVFVPKKRKSAFTNLNRCLFVMPYFHGALSSRRIDQAEQ